MIAESTPTEQQERIIKATEGYVCVPAVPGCGKTFCLTHRIAYLIQELFIAPDAIVALTFTRKAAYSMRQKLRGLIGDSASCFLGTFHHFCANVLKEEIHHIGYPKVFQALRRSDQNKFIRDILAEMELSARDYREHDILDQIAQFKEDRSYVQLLEREPIEFVLEEKIRRADAIGNIPKGIIYRYLLKEYQVHALDYNDLLQFTVYLFETYPEVLEKWQDRCEYVLVDEYQDVSGVQARLADLLSGKYKNLFIIGDDDQLIYSWRGSKPDYLIEFDQHHRNTQTFYLEQNFRSTPEIIAVSNEMIRYNQNRMEKHMVTQNSTGPKPIYNCTETAKDEAIWIAECIVENSKKQGTDGIPEQMGESAILVRSSRQANQIEQQLRLHGIPYIAYAGANFFESEEITTILAYLNMIIFLDDLSFEATVNTPRRGFGKTSMDKVRTYAREHGVTMFDALRDLICLQQIKNKEVTTYCRNMEEAHLHYGDYSPVALVNQILDWGYRVYLEGDPSQEKKDNVAELIQMIHQLEKEEDGEITLGYLMQYFALFAPGDEENGECKVKLMTIHTAKGLEFSTVYLPGMVEGVLPSGKARSKQDIEEERRVCYVAMTRAKERLYLSSYRYTYEKQGAPSVSSRFLSEMGEENLNMLQEPVRAERVKIPEEIVEKSEKGAVMQRVLVEPWGLGTIVEVDEERQKYKITFDGAPNLPKNISFAAKVKVL